jgi:hypothetical protein
MPPVAKRAKTEPPVHIPRKHRDITGERAVYEIGEHGTTHADLQRVRMTGVVTSITKKKRGDGRTGGSHGDHHIGEVRLGVPACYQLGLTAWSHLVTGSTDDVAEFALNLVSPLNALMYVSCTSSFQPLFLNTHTCVHTNHIHPYIQPYAVPTSRLTPNVTRYNLPSQNLHVGDVVWLFIDPTLATFVPKKDTSFDRELDLKVTLHHPKAFAKVNPAQRSMLVERYGDPSTWGLPNLEDYDDVPFDPQ